MRGTPAPRPRPRSLGSLLALAVLAVGLSLGGCASVGSGAGPRDEPPPSSPAPPPETPPALPAEPSEGSGEARPPAASPDGAEASPPAAPGPGDPPAADPAPGDAVWRLPPEAYGTQRLFRLRFEGPDGEGTLRATLRLETAERFQLSLADRLGRPVYTISYSGPTSGGATPADPARGTELGWLVDARREVACPLDRVLELPGLPLGSLPLDTLPTLLLGRVPAQPHGAEAASLLAALEGAETDEVQLDYRDGEGRRWTARVSLEGVPPTLLAWTFWERGEPAVWWRWTSGTALLSDRVRGLQVEIQESLSEPLRAPLPPLRPPEGVELQSDCRGVVGGLSS